MLLQRARVWVDPRDGVRYLVWISGRDPSVPGPPGNGRRRPGRYWIVFDDEERRVGAEYTAGKEIEELTHGELQLLLDRARGRGR